MNIKAKKAQDANATNKFVGMVIILLVLIVILIFVTKPQILDWIKNQPMFAPPVDTTKSLTADEAKALNYEAIGTVSIDTRTNTAFQQYFVWINDTTALAKTPIYWQVKDNVNGDIKISKAWSTDPTIGIVKNYFFLINFTQYAQQKSLFPNEQLMLKLNGSKYIGGILYKMKAPA